MNVALVHKFNNSDFGKQQKLWKISIHPLTPYQASVVFTLVFALAGETRLLTSKTNKTELLDFVFLKYIWFLNQVWESEGLVSYNRHELSIWGNEKRYLLEASLMLVYILAIYVWSRVGHLRFCLKN